MLRNQTHLCQLVLCRWLLGGLWYLNWHRLEGGREVSGSVGGGDLRESVGG